jgi:hypothetical protein
MINFIAGTVFLASDEAASIRQSCGLCPSMWYLALFSIATLYY